MTVIVSSISIALAILIGVAGASVRVFRHAVLAP